MSQKFLLRVSRAVFSAPPSRPTVSLRFYTKDNCSLCDAAHETLTETLEPFSSISFKVETVKVSPNLGDIFHRYRNKVPIVTVVDPSDPTRDVGTVAFGGFDSDDLHETLTVLFGDTPGPQFSSCPDTATKEVAALFRVPRMNRRRPHKVTHDPAIQRWWCSCGFSRDQPWCDGSHEVANAVFQTSFQPLPWQPEKEGVSGMCLCRRTRAPPRCDGEHKCLVDIATGPFPPDQEIVFDHPPASSAKTSVTADATTAPPSAEGVAKAL
eukprot:TRINITY_DN46584_c0_g1_i1.p1 TRINITY_DN46584_c0_g1~~TRINITY_DN46584_c0_g1_i1.p1  ORF type:complete len:267 (-),score=30.20 TRINITY_DN46584_c0_g1_i1:240-1040(-)